MEGHSMLVDTGREVGRFPILMHHLVFLLFGSKHTSEIFVCVCRAYHGQAAIKSCVIFDIERTLVCRSIPTRACPFV